MARMNKISLNDPEKDEIIIPTANMYSSPEILVRIVKCKNALVQFSYVKHHSLVELLSSNKDNKQKDEF